MQFIPLADLGDDAEAITARILDVAAGHISAVGQLDDDQAAIEGHQDDATALPWHVRASRRLLGDQGTWKP